MATAPHHRGALALGECGTIRYGSDLRLIESLTLRVNEVGLELRDTAVRLGLGCKDGATMLAQVARVPLIEQLTREQRRHERDARSG